MPRSNIFEAGGAEISQLFGDYIEGAPPVGTCIGLALSAHPLDARARNAIERSLEAIGLAAPKSGEAQAAGCCTYATLAPLDQTAEGGDILLDAQALFLLVEGLDPLCVIAADARATATLADASRCTLEPDRAGRAMGRAVAAFENLEELIGSDAGKQKAWKLFKSLVA